MRKVVLPIVAAFTALFAVPALAADATLSAASPTHTWEGSGMMGAGQGAAVPMGNARCTPVYMCHNTHVEVKDGGTLTVDIKAGSGSTDLDVRLFKSDEAGTAPGSPAVDEEAGSPVAEDIRTEKDAKIVVRNLKPGFYVIQVASYSAANGAFTGSATLAVATAAAPAAPAAPTNPAAPATPQQTSPSSADSKADEAKRKKKLASCKKKAKKIKNKKKRAKATKACAKKHGKKKP